MLVAIGPAGAVAAVTAVFQSLVWLGRSLALLSSIRIHATSTVQTEPPAAALLSAAAAAAFTCRLQSLP